MKKLIFSFALASISLFTFGQLRVVAPNGDVGVGTSTPLGKLHVDGDVRLTNPGSFNRITGVDDAKKMQFSNNLDANSSRAYFTMWGADAAGVRNGEFVMAGTYLRLFANVQNGNFGTEAMRILSTGDVGIGTAAPWERLAVAGNIVATGNVTWSDARLKTNIIDYTPGLDEVMQINPKMYNYNGDAGLKSKLDHVGVIAQEFETVAPYAVVEYEHVEEDVDRNVIAKETYKGVNEKAIQYMLVNAVKEQQKMIEELQAVILKQNATVATLTKRLETMELDESTVAK